MNQRELVALIAAALFLALVALAVRTVRKNSNTESWMIPTANLNNGDSPLASASGQYVSTVYADDPLRRFGGKQLMFRGKAAVLVFDNRVVIERDAETPLQISSEQIIEVGRNSASVDRGVENNGLLTITWLAGGKAVSTNLRLHANEDTAQFQNTLSSLIAREINR